MMEKNYYHVRMSKNDQFSIQTPANDGKLPELIAGVDVTRQTFSTGDELLQVMHGDRIDIYASFPINVERY